jgi:hypothetical protein
MSEENWRQFECVIGIRDSAHREAIVLWQDAVAIEGEFLPEAWLEDNGDTLQFPEEPGVYMCIVSCEVSAWGAEECEFSFRCESSQKIADFKPAASEGD